MKLLPINLDIPVNGYLHHAHVNSIILGQKPEAYHWINNMYLQLYYNDLNIDTTLDFFTFKYNFDCLETGYIRPFLLGDIDDIKSIIEKSIDNNFYITCLIDEFYVDGMPVYNKMHFDHWCLIFGYDNSNYYCVGYLKNGKYQKYCLPKNVFFRDCFKVKYGIGLNSVKDNYIFDNNDYAVQLIRDYIQGVNTSDKYGLISKKIEGSYGISIYNDLVKETEKVLDVRYAHILLEHKFCVCRFLNDNNTLCSDLAENYTKIISYCKTIKLLSIKQYAENSLATKKRIQNLLKKAQDEEYNILIKLLQ